LSVGELVPLYRSLEKALDAYDFGKAKAAVERMRASLQMGSGEESVPVNKERLAQVLEQLRTLVSGSDTMAQELLENEAGLLESAGFTEETRQMRKALDAYDFDGALAVLERLTVGH